MEHRISYRVFFYSESTSAQEFKVSNLIGVKGIKLWVKKTGAWLLYYNETSYIQIRRENLVDCSVSWQKRVKSCFLKSKLFSGITYFAHLNDFILLANSNYKICCHYTLEVLNNHLFKKSNSALFFLLISANLDTKFGSTVALPKRAI